MADEDAVAYIYENVAVVQPAYWHLGSVLFAIDDDTAAFAYVYENVT